MIKLILFEMSAMENLLELKYMFLTAGSYKIY